MWGIISISCSEFQTGVFGAFYKRNHGSYLDACAGPERPSTEHYQRKFLAAQTVHPNRRSLGKAFKAICDYVYLNEMEGEGNIKRSEVKTFKEYKALFMDG